MSKLSFQAILIIVLLAAQTNAMAEQNNSSAPADVKPAIETPNTAGTTSGEQPATPAPPSHVGFAKRTLGIITGVVVGTGVCVVRKPIDEEKYGVDQATNGTKKKALRVPAAILWAPFATVSGVLEAPFFALNNSLVHSDRPFSKEQWSLTEGNTTTDRPLKGTSER